MMSEEADNPGDSAPLRQRPDGLSSFVHNMGQFCGQVMQSIQRVDWFAPAREEAHRGGIQPIPD